MTTTPWSPARLPDSAEKTFVVTGGNAGIGYFISEQLASSGAAVVLASRSAEKASLAAEAIRARVPQARVRHLPLDLASIDGARAAGERIGDLERVDGIILNAAALAQNGRARTGDGHEIVFGTNYYGNVQLIASALPGLSGSDARIVTMGSVAQRIGRVDLDDLPGDARPYRGLRNYGSAKQAQMLFALELDRRLRASGSGMSSLIAHPGGALDGLTPDRAPAFAQTARDRRKAVLMRPFVQGKDRAAWPAVRAALDPDALGGQYWGPGSATGSRPPRLASIGGALDNRDLARALWDRTAQELDLSWSL